MNLLLRSTAILGMVCLSAHADVTVANVRSAQRASTKLVDIDYDLSGSTPPFTVSVRVSSDDGATFTVPVTSLAGAFGAGQEAGTNKRITWNAGVDWNGNYSANMRFEVTAIDTEVPVISDGFALIPAGNFEMGDSTVEGRPDEKPVHTVYVSAFYMAKQETTKELWDSVQGWGLAHGYTDLAVGNGSYPSKGAHHPVHSISWYDVVKWCNCRSEMEGLTPCYTVSGAVYRTGGSSPDCNWSANGYRLPTEAEWEKAARGNLSGKKFPWGDSISASNANFNVAGNPWRTGGLPFTSTVGWYPANGYGLSDMAGNVWEWTWDWYSSSYYGNPASLVDPQGPSAGPIRVTRGGTWFDDSSYLRVAYRGTFGNDLNYRETNVGFRTVRRF